MDIRKFLLSQSVDRMIDVTVFVSVFVIATLPPLDPVCDLENCSVFHFKCFKIAAVISGQ